MIQNSIETSYIPEYRKNSKPYKKRNTKFVYDLNGYFAYVKEHNLQADEISLDVLEMFRQTT